MLTYMRRAGPCGAVGAAGRGGARAGFPLAYAGRHNVLLSAAGFGVLAVVVVTLPCGRRRSRRAGSWR